ncbi:GH12 family glycosyl hydrolase domain-containing protein [Actinomycetospora chiangmaiensis]|uniref:GH12 family glycosyl hydrolase domain-containing protein n=1 Tax=Actinomycetospora chiangmaiensis TaxID=402650 RepID=UPI00035F03D2|nr:cutinase family protein [Actinomycetospora chiangmaiensis]
MGAADVRLEVVRTLGGAVVLADGRPLPVPTGGDPRAVALEAARRHAVRRGRVLRVDLVDGGVTRLAVGPSGPVEAFPTTGPLTPGPAAPTPVRVDAPTPAVRVSHWRPVVAPARERRPLGSLVAAALVAVAVLVGAVGTGVATLASSQALPDSCRPVTLYAVGGAGGGSDVLTAVTDPLAQRFGEKVSVVTVPPPVTGGSYAAAESAAVGALSDAVGDHVEGCPTGSIMLFGYSAGAQVAGDLASRIGTGLEPRIPVELVRAVGLFGDPARSPATRAVPEGTTGQGVLPPRAVGFGTLDARTIQICAPGDPVCDSPATAGNASLEQALTSPTHATYAQLPVAQGTSAPQWAAASLGTVVAAVPTDAGPAPSTTTTPSVPTTPGTGGAVGSATPAPGSEYEEESGATTATGAPGDPSVTETPIRVPGDVTATRTPDTGTGVTTRAPGADAGVTATRAPGSADPRVTTTRAPGSADPGVTTTRAPGSADTGVTTTRAPGSGAGGVTATRAPGASDRRVATTTRAPGAGSSGDGAGRSTTTRRTANPGEGTGVGDDPSSGGAGTPGRATGADFALTEGLAGFKSTPWNNQNATDPSDAASPNVPGREAVKFEMPGGGKRTEAEPDIPEFQDGETAFVGYSGFFDQGFPTDTGTWQLIMQFKQPGTGSPPLAVEVGNGQLRLANNGGNQKDFCPVGPGAFSFQLGITFGGTIDAYCNGQQTLSGYRTPESNVKGSAYLKTGIYRDESIGQVSVLFLNDLKIGDDLAAVSGLAGAPGSSGGGSGAAGTTSRAGGDGPAALSTSARRTAGAAPAAAPTSSRPAETANVRGKQVCDTFGSTEIAGGAFLVQNNEWGAADGQCITATTRGFTVDSGVHDKNDAPASYPSIMSGCWMGTCTEGTTLPRRISDLGPISSSIAGEIPAGTTSNLAYDIWADHTPRRNGHNDAVELMIWLKETGGIKPIGQQSGTATLGGATWDVWTGQNGGVNVISYVRQGYVDSADDLPLTDFVQDAVARGSVEATDFLTNIQAGFEPWTGGPGLALTRFEVRDDGGG